MSSPTIFDYLNSVNTNKKNLLEEYGEDYLEAIYVPRTINKLLSRHKDTVKYAKLLTRFSDMPKKDHYLFLLYSIPSKKRFSKIESKKIDNSEKIDLICKEYNYNKKHASEVVGLFKADDFKRMKKIHGEKNGKKSRNSC